MIFFTFEYNALLPGAQETQTEEVVEHQFTNQKQEKLGSLVPLPLRISPSGKKFNGREKQRSRRQAWLHGHVWRSEEKLVITRVVIAAGHPER